jgi:hypothetical protein
MEILLIVLPFALILAAVIFDAENETHVKRVELARRHNSKLRTRTWYDHEAAQRIGQKK